MCYFSFWDFHGSEGWPARLELFVWGRGGVVHGAAGAITIPWGHAERLAVLFLTQARRSVPRLMISSELLGATMSDAERLLHEHGRGSF
jgi:hypothetical protein